MNIAVNTSTVRLLCSEFSWVLDRQLFSLGSLFVCVPHGAMQNLKIWGLLACSFEHKKPLGTSLFFPVKKKTWTKDYA